MPFIVKSIILFFFRAKNTTIHQEALEIPFLTTPRRTYRIGSAFILVIISDCNVDLARRRYFEYNLILLNSLGKKEGSVK